MGKIHNLNDHLSRGLQLEELMVGLEPYAPSGTGYYNIDWWRYRAALWGLWKDESATFLLEHVYYAIIFCRK